MTDIIKSRRSIRNYKQGTQVSKAQLEQMLEAAMFAPSACNTRPWEFIAITKREVLDEIAKSHPYAKMIKSASAAIIVVALPQEGLAAGYYAQDCAAATQNILLQAASIGLGTCWCGVYPMDDRIATMRTILGIPEPKIPFNVIAVGIPGESPDARGFFEEEKVTYIL